MFKYLLPPIILLLLLAFIAVWPVKAPIQSPITTRQTNSLSPSPTLPPPPVSKTLSNTYHIFQNFNNCGPASLSMALSYFGIHKSQEELGQALRPYQNPQGDNDDKSVTLDELAAKAQEYGLLTYHRPNGDTALLKQFIANDIPVITRTWLTHDEDIGHYRIVKGYDDTTHEIIQDDSYQGKNLRYSYGDFNTIWEKFDNEYLVLVPREKKQVAEKILGRNLDERIAWQQALKKNEAELTANPSDIYSQFNVSVASYYLGDYAKSVAAFEKVQGRLPARTLWYQIEPIEAYFALGDYEKVFSLTDTILNNHNRAFSELYVLRGKAYQKQDNLQAAKEAFEKAVFYNKNLKSAQESLLSLR